MVHPKQRTLHELELLGKFKNKQVNIGTLYIKMQEDAPPSVISTKGWVSLHLRKKFPYNLKWIPLQPQVALEPFEKWCMDFIGSSDPPSGQKYIIVRNDNLTKCAETKRVEATNELKVVEFLWENIF